MPVSTVRYRDSLQRWVRGASMRSFAERLWTLVSGGDDRLRVHGGERTAEPQRPASRDGDHVVARSRDGEVT